MSHAVWHPVMLGRRCCCNTDVCYIGQQHHHCRSVRRHCNGYALKVNGKMRESEKVKKNENCINKFANVAVSMSEGIYYCDIERTPRAIAVYFLRPVGLAEKLINSQRILWCRCKGFKKPQQGEGRA